MFRLIKEMIDQTLTVRVAFGFERPGHAIHERRRASVTLNLHEVFEELGVAIGDGMHAATGCPVARLMHDATSLFHAHR